MAYREVWIADGDNSRWETVYVPDPVRPAAVAATPAPVAAQPAALVQTWIADGDNGRWATSTPAPAPVAAQPAVVAPAPVVASVAPPSVPVSVAPSYVAGQSTLPAIEERTVDMGEGTRSEYFIKGTNIPVDAPTYFEDYSQGQLTESSTPTLVANNITIYDPKRQGEYVYSPTGQYLGFKEAPRDSSFLGGLREIATETAPIWTAALAANAGSLFGGAGTGAAGTAAVTDAGLLAADAAQLASQGLSESAISQVLGSAGYASTPAANLAASMAANGLDVATMTQQLGNLSANTGLMSQTGSAADFVAADALQLQGQVGNNFAAIEQNLAASGVDPLIAADISQQIAFNPNLTQTELATNLSNSFGNNIYDVNMATTYPTSVLPDTGGLMNAPAAGVVAGSATGSGATAGATAGAGLTNSQIANLIKAGLGVASAAGAVNAVGSRPTTPLQAPTQGMPTYSPEYYQQLQQYYNAYLPQTPRDVVSPLQQWYNSSYGA